MSYVTGVLGRYQSNPGIEHGKMIKKALCYVRGTTGLMLTYRKSESLEIEGYSESDFAGHADDRKSTSGCIFTLAKGSDIVEKFQAVTASSTMYAKFVACYEASGQVTWLKKLVPDRKWSTT